MVVITYRDQSKNDQLTIEFFVYNPETRKFDTYGWDSDDRPKEVPTRDIRLIGCIKEVSGGKLEGRNAGGRLKGTYDPRTNETRDASGRLIGKQSTFNSHYV
jgi:hypothetical protein